MHSTLKNLLTVVVAATSLTCVLTSCENELPSSKTKTLDGLLDQTNQDYGACVGPFSANGRAERDGHPIPNLDAFSAVPDAWKTSAGDLNTVVELVKPEDVAKLCSARKELQSIQPALIAGKLTSCWVRSATDGSIKIILADDPKVINFELLRAYAYVYVQPLNQRILQTQNAAAIGATAGSSVEVGIAPVTSFQSWTAELTAKLLEQFSGSAMPPGVTKYLQGPTWASLLQNPRDMALKTKLIATQEGLTFSAMVAAEAFHSAFCNDATRATLRAKFSNIIPNLALRGKLLAPKQWNTWFHDPDGARMSAVTADFEDSHHVLLQTLRAGNKDRGLASSALLVREVSASSGSLGLSGGLLQSLISLLFGGFSNGSGLGMLSQPLGMNMLGSLGQLFNGGLNGGYNPGPCGGYGGCSGGGGYPNLGGNLNPNLGGNLNPNLGGNLNPNLGGNLNPNLGGNLNPNLGGGGNSVQGDIAQQVLDLTNKCRKDAGVTTPLVLDQTLNAECQDQAQAQAQLSTFDQSSHTLHGFGSAMAENIARGQETPQEVVMGGGWCYHPGHRENIINPDYTRMGVAYFDGPNGRDWAQRFR